MSFSERLKEKRYESRLNQNELAKLLGITTRSIQNYEAGTKYPNVKVGTKMAKILNTSMEYLFGEDEMFIVEAQTKSGTNAAKDISVLVREVNGMFAGGKLDDDALDGAMKAINDAYWRAKEKNKRTKKSDK